MIRYRYKSLLLNRRRTKAEKRVGFVKVCFCYATPLVRIVAKILDKSSLENQAQLLRLAAGLFVIQVTEFEIQVKESAIIVFAMIILHTILEVACIQCKPV